VTKPLRTYEKWPISLSPDQTRVAYSRDAVNLAELRVQDLVREIATRFTVTPGVARNPVWSADGTSMYCAFQPAGGVGDVLFRKPTSGSGQEERVFDTVVNGWISDQARWPVCALQPRRH
jgi:hypothetical protein